MKTYESVCYHYEMVKQEFEEANIVASFLYGSQNYKINTTASDVDTKTVILPTFKDLCESNRPVSKTIILPNEEHAVVKDLRTMVNEWCKSGPEAIEILFTDDYNFSSPDYKLYWDEFVAMREDVARIEPNRMVAATLGELSRWSKQFETEQAQTDPIYSDRVAAKLLRLSYFLNAYIEEVIYHKESYYNALWVVGGARELIKAIKNHSQRRELYYSTVRSAIEMAELAGKHFLNEAIETRPNEATIYKLHAIRNKMLRYAVERNWLSEW